MKQLDVKFQTTGFGIFVLDWMQLDGKAGIQRWRGKQPGRLREGLGRVQDGPLLLCTHGMLQARLLRNQVPFP